MSFSARKIFYFAVFAGLFLFLGVFPLSASASTYYWVGNGGNWNATTGSNYTHWATSSNGSPQPNLPTSSDSVVFDSHSGTGTAYININVTIVDFNNTGASSSLGYYINSGITLTSTGTITLGSGTGMVSNYGTVNAVAFSGPGQLRQYASSILNYSGSATPTINLVTWVAANAVNYTGDINQSVLGGITYYDLTLGSGITANRTFTLSASSTYVSHVLTIGTTANASMTTLDTGASGLSISGTGTPMVINHYAGAATAKLSSTSSIKYIGDGATTMASIDYPQLYVGFLASLANSNTYSFSSSDQSIITVNTLTIGPVTESNNKTQVLDAGNKTIVITGIGASAPFVINTYGSFNASTSTVNFIRGDSAQTIVAATYYNLQIAVGATMTNNIVDIINGNTTVSNVLTVGQTDAHTITFSSGSYTLTLSGTGIPVVMNANGSFSTAAGTVSYTGNGATTVAGTTYYNLRVGNSSSNSSQTYTLGGNTTVAGVLTVGPTTGNAQTLSLSSYTLTLSGTGTPLAFTAGYGLIDNTQGTVSYTGNGATTVAGTTYYNLQVGNSSSNSSQTYTLGGNASVAGVLTIGPVSGNPQTLKEGGHTLTLSGTGTPMVINTNGIFSASSAGDAVCYTGNGSTNITATTYRSLYVGTDSSGGVTETGARTYTLAGNITAIQLIVGPTSGSYNQTLNDGGNTITFTGNNFVLNKGIFSPTGTVDYTQDSGDVTIKVLNYYNLQIGVGVSPTGTHKYTLNNNATVNGTFTIGSTTSSPVQTFSPGSYILSIGNSLTSGAPLVINSYSGTATGAIDTTTGTIKYNGVGSFSMPATSFYNLTLQQTSTYTPAGAINIYGNLTVTDATLNPSGNLITGVGASNTLSATGKIIVDQTTFVGNYSGFETITLGTGSTVSYSANTATTINNFSYYNLNVGVDASLSAPCTYTMAGDTSVSHVLTIGQTSNANIATLSPGVYALKITGTGTPVVLNSYSSTKTGAFYSTAGTVNYAGAGSTNIASATYYNLQAGNDATISSQTYTLAGDITVMNVLTIGPASGGNQQTLKEWGHVITLSGTGTPLVINTNGFLNVQTAGDTVYYQGNGSTNITATTYRNLYIGTNNSRTETQSGSRIYTLLGDISAGQIQVGPTSGSWTQTLNDGGYTITMTSAGAVIFSVNNNGALLATGTVNYLGGADSWIGHATYYNLQVGNAVSQATTNYNLNGNTAVAGVLTVGSSGGSNQQTLNDQGFTITLSGTGTPLVVNNNGAVSFTGTVSYTGSAVNIMQVSYYNLTLNAPQTATFSHSATTMISGSFTAVGSVGNIITINSDLSGSPATLSKASGIVSCDYISLKDNTATGGAAWHAGAHSTQVSDVTGWLDFNTAPVFSPGPSDGNSSTDTPTNAGSSVNFSAVATDNEYDNYYLAVCKTGAVTPHSNSAPTCDGGSWCISVNIATGYSASCSYLTSAGSAESNAWYAFVCDKNISSLCSPVSQGAEDNSGSPFIVNHAPAFSAVSVSVNPVASGAQQTFSATASDTDTGGAVVFYACKSNDFTGSACGSAGEWCHSQTSVSNPSCNYTVQAGDGKGAKNYFGYIVDNHSFSPTNNPIFGTFAISGNSSSSIVKLSGHIKINGGAIVK